MAERYLHLKCPCGRSLRAGLTKAGSTVRCWDCRGEVSVPLPRMRGRLAAEVAEAFRDSAGSETLGRCLAAALVSAALLAVDGAGLALAVLPVAAFAALRRVEGRDAITSAWSGVKRHPWAVLLVALALPVGLVAAEAGLVGVAYEQDWLRFLVLDLSPREGSVKVLGGGAEAGGVDLPLISDSEVGRIYAYGLRRGRALTWAIPASLANGTGVRNDSGYAFANAAAWHDWVDPSAYFAYRALAAVASLTLLAWVLVAQARAVALIGTVEERFVASLGRAGGASDPAGRPVSLGPAAVEVGHVPFQPWAGSTVLGIPSPGLGAAVRLN